MLKAAPYDAVDTPRRPSSTGANAAAQSLVGVARQLTLHTAREQLARAGIEALGGEPFDISRETRIT